jgi:head-tail adaptor
MRRRGGTRRHLVSLQAITGRVASGDGYLNTWTSYGTAYASVQPATASAVERLTAGTLETPITHIVEMDYRAAIRPQHRVWLQESRALYIRGMQNVDERDMTTVLLCEERPS